MCQEHAFALGIERLLGIEAPKRGQYIRVMFAELTRILNHLLNNAHFIMDAGATSPMLWMYEQRDKIIEFCERVSGARFHAAYFRPGEFCSGLASWSGQGHCGICDQYLVKLEEIESLITHNRIFKQRAVDIGKISAEDAMAYGFTGVMLRGSNVAWDLRKAQPYDCYDEVEFDVPRWPKW